MMMQSSGRRVSALIMALSRNGVFFIPSLLIMAKVWGLFGIQSAQMAADILTMILIIPFTIHYFRTLPEDAPD